MALTEVFLYPVIPFFWGVVDEDLTTDGGLAHPRQILLRRESVIRLKLLRKE